MSALLRKKPVHQVVVCTEYGLYLLLYYGTIRNPQNHGTYTVVVPTVWVRTGLCICVFKVESFNMGHWTRSRTVKKAIASCLQHHRSQLQTFHMQTGSHSDTVPYTNMLRMHCMQH